MSRYPLITAIIIVMWICLLIVCSLYAALATSIFILGMVSTVLFFYLGFIKK